MRRPLFLGGCAAFVALVALTMAGCTPCPTPREGASGRCVIHVEVTHVPVVRNER